MEPKATKESVMEKIKGDGVEFLLAQFVDINGSVKVKQVPSECFGDIVEDGAGFAGAAVWAWGRDLTATI